MHVAYLCWFQVIWSCWRANWKKRTWSCQTTRPPGRVDASRLQQTTRPLGRVEDLSTSRHHSTPWSSTAKGDTRSHHLTPWSSIFNSTTWPSLDHITLPGSRYHHHHHSTTYSMASFRVFFIPHSTRHSSTRKKRRLQLFTRPPTRPHGSSTVLNPSQYFVVLSIRVSEYLAISSMYFTFSQTSFYLVLFRRHCVLDLCNPDFSLSIQYSVFVLDFVYCCSSCYHLAITLLLSCFHSIQRLCSLQWCLSSE